MKNTALPWEYRDTGIYADNVQIAKTFSIYGQISATESDANRYYIVHACNAFPALVEALECVEQTVSHSVDCASRHPFGECDCLKSVVSSALAQAKGEK